MRPLRPPPDPRSTARRFGGIDDFGMTGRDATRCTRGSGVVALAAVMVSMALAAEWGLPED